MNGKDRRRVLITSVPFGQADPASLAVLKTAGADYVLNPLGRRPTEEELAEMIGGFDALIAGGETITDRVMGRAPNLRLIARLGIGLDKVDLAAARARHIQVTYTPDAPAPAVAELTIGLMLALLRFIPQADRAIRQRKWLRPVGRRLADQTVGVIGVGRVGRRVISLLTGFGCSLLASDTAPTVNVGDPINVHWVDKETIYREADIITLHLPRTAVTADLIAARELRLMKSHALLVNTSRGELVNEQDLVEALREGRIGGAGLDVFAAEPYTGELADLENTVLTSHIGSMSHDCRARMELEAAREVARFIAGEPPLQPAPLERLIDAPADESKPVRS